MPVLLRELDSCANFVPMELADTERTSAETLELAAKIKKIHVTGETPAADNFMDVSIIRNIN